MNAVSSLFRALLLFLLITAGLASAAEPASLAKMSDRDFAKWIVGTEWAYEQEGDNKRKVWFVTPDVCIYTRINGSSEYVYAFPWSSVGKGVVRYLVDRNPEKPVDLAVGGALTTAGVTRTNDKVPMPALLKGRRDIGEEPPISKKSFTDWLRGAQLNFGGEITDFPEGRLRSPEKDSPAPMKVTVVRPGVIEYYWAENPLDPLLMVFSRDLTKVTVHIWHGTYQGKVITPPPPDLPRTFTFADGRTVEGTLLKADATTVTILRAIDGKQSLLTTAELGEADRKHVNEWLTAPERQRIEVTANKGKVARDFAGNASKDARFGTSNVNGQTTEVWQWEITVRNETAFPLTGATVEYTQYVGARGSESRKRKSAGESTGQLTLPEIPPFKSCTVKTKETTVTSTRNVNNYNDSLGRPQVSVYTRKETLDGIRASVLYKGQTLEEYTLGSGGREAEKKD